MSINNFLVLNISRQKKDITYKEDKELKQQSSQIFHLTSIIKQKMWKIISLQIKATRLRKDFSIKIKTNRIM